MVFRKTGLIDIENLKNKNDYSGIFVHSAHCESVMLSLTCGVSVTGEHVLEHQSKLSEIQGPRGGAVWLRHCSTSRKFAGLIPDGLGVY